MHTNDQASNDLDTMDATTLRRIAVDAGCDPRTVKKVLRGDPVLGAAFYRAKAALEAAGFAVPQKHAARRGGDRP